MLDHCHDGSAVMEGELLRHIMETNHLAQKALGRTAVPPGRQSKIDGVANLIDAAEPSVHDHHPRNPLSSHETSDPGHLARHRPRA
jgi:hypothetical protein